MANLKHVGRVINTDRKCVVVFREIYDDMGHVIDHDNCLVFETENLPEAEHQELMQIIESEAAQNAGEVFNVLARSRLGSGMVALNWLVTTERLRKYPTSNVMLMPNGTDSIRLDKLNTIVNMQASGSSEAAINAAVRDIDNKKVNKATVTDEAMTDASDGVLDDTKLAASYIEQAKMFAKQAEELTAKAFELNPDLKPKRGRPPKNKKAT